LAIRSNRQGLYTSWISRALIREKPATTFSRAAL
jgi:hypothetical protein